MTKQKERVVLRTVGRTMADLGARLNVWRRQGELLAREIRRAMEQTHQMLAELGGGGARPRRAIARVPHTRRVEPPVTLRRKRRAR
jgi:hypothetical protein